MTAAPSLAAPLSHTALSSTGLSGAAASSSTAGLHGISAWVVGVMEAVGADRQDPLLAVDDVDRVEAWFARHGSKAVLLGRLVPLFRSLISPSRPALTGCRCVALPGPDARRQPHLELGPDPGRIFSQCELAEVEEYAGALQLLVAATVAGLVVLFVARKLRELRKRRENVRI